MLSPMPFLTAGTGQWFPIRESQLSAGYAHVAGQCRLLVTAVDDEIMAFRLAADRFADRGMQRLIAFRRPQRCPQVCSVFLAEAHVKRAGAGQPHPVAALAEVMGQGCDESQSAAGLLDSHIARRPAGSVRDVVESEAFRKPCPDERERQVLIGPVAIDVA